VGDHVFVAGQIGPVLEAVVQHAIETVRLVREAAHGIGLVAFALAQPTKMSAFDFSPTVANSLPMVPSVGLK
jgi:hypothetical protein